MPSANYRDEPYKCLEALQGGLDFKTVKEALHKVFVTLSFFFLHWGGFSIVLLRLMYFDVHFVLLGCYLFVTHFTFLRSLHEAFVY